MNNTSFLAALCAHLSKYGYRARQDSGRLYVDVTLFEMRELGATWQAVNAFLGYY